MRFVFEFRLGHLVTKRANTSYFQQAQASNVFETIPIPSAAQIVARFYFT